MMLEYFHCTCSGMSGGAAVLLHILLCLEGEQAAEVVEHLLVLGQLEGGVGSVASLELGGLGGVDGDHTYSQQ
jgi:hypothetical protein